jgi:amidohydrolase
MDIKAQIKKLVSQYYPEILEIRRHIHAHPELSFEEFETSACIRKNLDDWGINYRHGFAGTGIIAVLDGKGPGKIIGLRADMDALPVQEENDLPFKSKVQGKMHACGHDVHSSVLLGVIRVMNEIKNNWEGRIKFVFQPAEERVPGGARQMIKESALGPDNPELMIAQHVYPELEAGKAGFCPGRYMASSDEIYITVLGRGGHGAMPDKVTDPVLISAHLITSLQQIVSRNAMPGIPTVLSFGKVTANGSVNVIPDEVKIEGTLRTMNEEWRKKAHTVLKDICDHVTRGMGGRADLEIRHGYPVLINDPEVTGMAESFAREILNDQNIIRIEPRMTSEDFAYFSEICPCVLYRLGTSSDMKNVFSLHTSKFMVDERSIQTGMELMSWLCLRFLGSGKKT